MIFQVKYCSINGMDDQVWIQMQLIGSIPLPSLFVFLIHTYLVNSMVSFFCWPVLRIRDVYPGSVFFHPGSRGKKSTGSRIRNTVLNRRALRPVLDPLVAPHRWPHVNRHNKRRHPHPSRQDICRERKVDSPDLWTECILTDIYSSGSGSGSRCKTTEKHKKF